MAKILTVGDSFANLDIFLSAAGNPVTATYVGFKITDAIGTQVTSGVATTPQLGQYIASGILPAGYALGLWNVRWDIITAGNGLVIGDEPFTAQEIALQIGFQPATDKTETIYDSIRIDIGDPDAQIFGDNFLKRIVIKAVRRLNQRLGLSHTSRPKGIPGNFGGQRLRVQQIELDVEAGTIIPLNDEICDLVIMQSEVIILESEISSLKRLSATTTGPYAAVALSASQDGITVTNADGVTVSVSPSRLSNRVALYKYSAETARKELEDAIRAFLNRNTGSMGKMVY